jgi:hypothetical protein
MKYIPGIVGLLIAAASGFALWSVMQPTIPPHIPDRHVIYLFAGGVFFGALLIIPTVIVTTLKSLLDVIGKYIPVIGGRRAGDPPADPPAAP